VAGVKGKTGSPGKPNPKKKNATSFVVAPGEEPKGRMMGFRPPRSLESRIDRAVAASGLKLSEWLQEAAIAYLESNSFENSSSENRAENTKTHSQSEENQANQGEIEK